MNEQKRTKIDFRDLLLFIICRSTRADLTPEDLVKHKLVLNTPATSLERLGPYEATFAAVQKLWATEAEYTPPPCPDVPELQAIRAALDASKRFKK